MRTAWAVSLLLHSVAVIALLSIPDTEDRTTASSRSAVMPLVYRPEVPVQTPHAPVYIPAKLIRTPLVVRAPEPAIQPVAKPLPVIVPEPPRPHAPTLEIPEPVPQATLPDVPATVRLKTPDLPSRPPTPPAPPVPVKTGVFGSAGDSPTGHVPAPNLEVHTGAFGAADASPSRVTPASTVHTGGFGESASAGSASGSSRPAVVAAAGFGSTAVQNAPAHRVEAGAAETPVEVIWKPKPLYTEEARAKKLEGNVTLEVVFRATGEVQVIRVVRGLGSGLDESARSAAEQIRFHPGKKDGVPVDRTGLVQITFELS
jgi:TonB family protein